MSDTSPHIRHRVQLPDGKHVEIVYRDHRRAPDRAGRPNPGCPSEPVSALDGTSATGPALSTAGCQERLPKRPRRRRRPRRRLRPPLLCHPWRQSLAHADVAARLDPAIRSHPARAGATARSGGAAGARAGNHRGCRRRIVRQRQRSGACDPDRATARLLQLRRRARVSARLDRRGRASLADHPALPGVRGLSRRRLRAGDRRASRRRSSTGPPASC